MKIQPIYRDSPDPAIIDEAADVLTQGGVVVFPADTCYGMAVDPTQPKALRALFALKGRAEEKAVSCIFSSLKHITKWAMVDKTTEEILTTHLPGAFTFLLKPTPAYPLPGQRVGVRMPDNPLTHALATTLNQPYTATSANKSDAPSCYSVSQLLAQFPPTGPQPDLILDSGALPPNSISTVVDLCISPPQIVRHGTGAYTK